MDKFWKIVVVVAAVVAVESQEHRPLVLSGQDGGSNYAHLELLYLVKDQTDIPKYRQIRQTGICIYRAPTETNKLDIISRGLPYVYIY